MEPASPASAEHRPELSLPVLAIGEDISLDPFHLPGAARSSAAAP